MACSKFGYVKKFERDDKLLPETYIVCRLDGRGFTKLTAEYELSKPNDVHALWLMNFAAMTVMEDLKDILLAYGQSDEYSFVLRPDTSLFNRRESKILSTVLSTFTAAYVKNWDNFMGASKPLGARLPSFDARIILYPNAQTLRDYLSWRQADCHINNLYNTTFWALVHRGMERRDVYERLKDTNSSQKNEILYTECGLNYNNEPDIYRKGTLVYRHDDQEERGNEMFKRILKNRYSVNCPEQIGVHNEDIIRDKFWGEHPWLLPIHIPLSTDIS